MQAARDEEVESLQTSVKQLQAEVHRLQRIESRVDVMDAALSEAREHSAAREQQERKLREGMERKYSLKMASKVTVIYQSCSNCACVCLEQMYDVSTPIFGLTRYWYVFDIDNLSLVC